MQVMIDTLMHEMAHADVEVKQLPIGRGLKAVMENSHESGEANRSMLEALVDTQLNLDVDRIRKSKMAVGWRHSAAVMNMKVMPVVINF